MNTGHVIDFTCVKDCSDSCCSGATLLTIEEIRGCYALFPVTVGFRNYIPLSAAHRDLLEMIGVREGGLYVVGDFVAGNRLRKRCRALGKNGLCGLQRNGQKPHQCRLVPFCALYPEDMQDMVLSQQRQGAFAACRGILGENRGDHVVWKQGRFTDPAYRAAFYAFQRGLMRQRGIMLGIVEDLRRQRVYRDFLGGEGILEAALTPRILCNVLALAGFSSEESRSFVREQARLCAVEVTSKQGAPAVVGDSLAVLNEMARPGAGFTEACDGNEGGSGR